MAAPPFVIFERWAPGRLTGHGEPAQGSRVDGTKNLLASYSVNDPGSGTTSYYLATTSGAGVASQSTVSVPGQQGPVQPVLQRADGSYIGNVSTSTGNPMIAFTSSGSTLWMAPNDTPQIATADGGVIGASGTTYDQNGNVTGQTANIPTQSWAGSTYQAVSVAAQRIASTAVSFDLSFWALQGANNSTNYTAVQQAPYAQLISCYDKTLPQPVKCPGPREVVWNAYLGLQKQVQANGPQMQSFVFNHLQDSSGGLAHPCRGLS